MQIDRALTDLRDKDLEIKKMAVRAILKEIKDPEDIMSPVLKDADNSTKEIVYDALFEDSRDFSTLFHEAAKDPDPKIRGIAIRYLLRKGEVDIKTAIKWLDDKDPYVRRRVLSYLGWTKDQDTLKKVACLAVADSDPALRKEALGILGIWESKEAVGDVIKILDDEEIEFKRRAMKILEKITGKNFGDPYSVPDEELEWISVKWKSWWELMGGKI